MCVEMKEEAQAQLMSVTFKLLSLNARVIRSFEKRKAVFAANETTSGYLLLARNVQYKGD